MGIRLALIGCGLVLACAVSVVEAEVGGMLPLAASDANGVGLEGLPARPVDAIDGTTFAAATDTLDARARQDVAVREILRGNIPDFERALVPVAVGAVGVDGRHHNVTFWVTPDYLAIGSEGDFLRMPLDLPAAITVASSLGCLLPTPRMVDAIYAQSGLRLTPSPLPPGPQMRSNNYILTHRDRVDAQIATLTRGVQRASPTGGKLIAGHKKDVVLTNRYLTQPDRVAIYGWHRPTGQPIQPLSLVHGSRYFDYSHGVRLVHDQALADGELRSVYDLLSDPVFAPLLSSEGPMPSARALMHTAPKADSIAHAS